MANLKRTSTYGNEIFIVDGMWRTGKSLLGPIIGCFDGVQKPKIDYNYEKDNTYRISCSFFK